MCDEKYQPIACSEYDRYEIAIMRNTLLDLSWLDGSGMKCHQTVRPVNLKILNSVEYLVVELKPDNASSLLEIRLDKILTVK